MSTALEINLNKMWIQKSSSGDMLEYPNFSIEVRNNSSFNLDGVVVDYFIIGAKGGVIGFQEFQSYDCSIPAMSKNNLEITAYETDIAPSDFDFNGQRASLYIRVSGYRACYFDFGEFAIPTGNESILLFKDKDINEEVHVISAVLSRGSSDGGESEVNARFVLKKNVQKLLSRFEIKGEVLDKSGKIVDDNFGAMNGVNPEMLFQSRGFACIKDKKLKEAKVHLAVNFEVIETKFAFAKYEGFDILTFDEANSGKSWEFPG